MANTNVNKVVINGVTKIDLTGDTVAADKVLSGYTFHLKSGAPSTGTCSYDSNTQDATADANEILSGETAYVAGAKVTGAMVNNGAVTGTISTKDGQYTIPVGYHDGSGKVGIATEERNKIIESNIKSGISILGVTGGYSGEAVRAQSNKNASPTFASQTILPDSGYDYLAQVTVAAIPVTYVDNASGGQTCTVG